MSVFKILRETLKSSHNPFSYNIDLTKEKIEKINVSLMNGTNFNIPITKFTKAFEVCREIAKQIGLVSWLDFKLFLANERGDEKMVDDQEFMFKVLHIEEDKNGASIYIYIYIFIYTIKIFIYVSFLFYFFIYLILVTDFFGKIKNGFQSVLSYLNLFIKYRLIFKKLIYLEGNIEEKDYKYDLIKCDLLVSQVTINIIKIEIYFNL